MRKEHRCYYCKKEFAVARNRDKHERQCREFFESPRKLKSER